jgi:hypothetical protein
MKMISGSLAAFYRVEVELGNFMLVTKRQVLSCAAKLQDLAILYSE